MKDKNLLKHLQQEFHHTLSHIFDSIKYKTKPVMPSIQTKNIIYKTPISKLGYDFIKPEYLPQGKDEYYLRDLQENSGRKYRRMTAYEIEVLVSNNNTSDDWNNILVSNAFNPELVKNCKFNGLIRIGKLEPICLTFSNLTTPVGLYNSNIISCDFGDNVVVDNVCYLSHYIIGDEVILVNIHEMITSDTAKFGNGIVKDGEDESKRVWLEICNENAGRKVLPFNGMQAADAFLWSKYRDDEALLEKFKQFTEGKFSTVRGYYGKIGSRSVIKNTRSMKDVWVGEDAYIKGANKLKNLTINSGNGEGRTQIGEGCELVNGIIGYGCRIFYGVKAVRFVTASHSQLKYGARLINSFLGYNSTISCCEVLNSLIFGSHEQHHNNSFLCASVLLGQSNLAAGATIGSNHNSRGADGEIIAGRGFWPGLCVSLKHNSKFASFTILAKGDYSNELNITIPFSLVSIDVANDKLLIMPAYWFMYNMYALERNAWKYVDRDKRTEKIQHLEYGYLAPDTVNEMLASLNILERVTGTAWYRQNNLPENNDDAIINKGRELLNENNSFCNRIEVDGGYFENDKRNAIILKAGNAYQAFKQIIHLYAAIEIAGFVHKNNFAQLDEVLNQLPMQSQQNEWQNLGGQIIQKTDVDALKLDIKSGKIKSWDEVHEFYRTTFANYSNNKLQHAINSVCSLHNTDKIDGKLLHFLLTESITTKEWMMMNIALSREKDYTNSFRKMVYDTTEEMNNVLGDVNDNAFIKQQKKELKSFILDMKKISSQLFGI